MTASDAKADHHPANVVTSLIKACQARDLDTVINLIDPGIEYENVPIGVVYGHEGVMGVLAGGLTRAAEEVEWIIEHQVVEGEHVMHERVDRFLVNGFWMSVRIAARFRVSNGRVVLWRDFFDLADYRKQRIEAGLDAKH